MLLLLTRGVVLVVAAGLCVYGVWCAIHMHKYIGTPEYWSNRWFYKAHAVLAAVMALWVVSGWLGRRNRE